METKAQDAPGPYAGLAPGEAVLANAKAEGQGQQPNRKMHDFRDLVLKHGLAGARRLAATPTERACVDAAWAMLERPQENDCTYASRILTTLPHRGGRTMRHWRREADDDGAYTWRSGDYAGTEMGIPSGAKARIILIHLLNEAIRTGSSTVAVGGSMYEWARIVSRNLGGQTYNLVAEQSMAIASCHVHIALQEGEGGRSIYGRLVEQITHGGRRQEFGAALHPNAPWLADFPVRIRLNEKILRHLVRRAILVRTSALEQISNNSAAIDLYIRLSARLPNLQTPLLAQWDDIAQRFGPGYKNKRHLKSAVHDLLQLVMAVYPEARVEIASDGLLLHPSRSPITPSEVH